MYSQEDTRRSNMAENGEGKENDLPRPAEINDPSSDDDLDVHYCGKCKLSFTDLSRYIQHKRDRICRDALNKGSLSKVVEKLSSQGTPPRENSAATTEDGGTAKDQVADDDGKDKECPSLDDSSCGGKVEVQFLEPLACSSGEEKPPSRRKRKSSTPKTTRKRKASSSTCRGSGGSDKTSQQVSKQSPAAHSQEYSVTVHIPESQLVHLNSGAKRSLSSPHGAGVRKQGATSVFVPIYLTPPAKNYQCFRCSAEFKSKEEKDEHGKMHKKEFRCAQCSKTFYTANGFDQHRANESHSHPCDDCSKVFSSVANLRRHKTTHSTERPHGCDECDKSFCSPANLRSHKRTVHVTEKKHKCPECGKAFARKDKMRRHSLIHYPDTRPTFTCPFRSHTGCMKTFYREDKLKRHLFTHSKDKPFKCELCSKGYARRDNLNDHMRSHTGQYSHHCRLCNKGFLGPHKLKKHMKSAHGERWAPGPMLDQLDTQPPTMVPRKTTSPPLAIHEESEPSSPEALSDLGEEEGFGVSGSGSAEEPTSEEEQAKDEEQSPSPAARSSRPTPQASVRPVLAPEANTRRLTSPPASSYPAQVTEVSGHPDNTSGPPVSARPGPTSPVTSPGSTSQVTAHLVPTPKTNLRQISSPQINTRPISSLEVSAHSLHIPPHHYARPVSAPQASVRPVSALQTSARPVPAPQASVRPLPSPHVGARSMPAPRVDVRPEGIPQISVRSGPLPQVRARPVPASPVGVVQGPFIPPPLQSGMNPSAELIAFTNELFPVVGRYQQ